jgi:sugar transferase (PEP-CTERM system associated)
LVVGGGERAKALDSMNDSYMDKGFAIVGYFVLPGEKVSVDESLIVSPDQTLAATSEELDVDEIVIALDDKRLKMPIDDLLDCKMSGLKIMDSIMFYEQEKGIISLNDLYPSWLVYSDGFAQGGIKTISKRVFDIVASAALLLVAWPFMALTAFAIYAESGFKGSVIYKQQRVGENEKIFEVLKFRSMTMDAEKNGPQWAAQNDKRITRVGSFIRKCRIDELPQIFNVFNGEMSFVGPRPERPEFVQGFEERIPYYRERHRVKPGITGWAQLCYPYGANEYDTIQKLQYDLYYVKNYSFFLDVAIMLNTVEVILMGKGSR